MRVKYQKNIPYLLLLLLAAALLLLKVWRGLIYHTEEQGGIWNIIQVILVGTGILCLFSKSKSFSALPCIKAYIVFFLYIWFLALFPFLGKTFDIPHVFRFLVIPYGVMSLLTFYTVGYKANILQYPWVLGITFIVLVYWMFTKWRAYNLAIIDSNGAVADVYYLVGLLPLILLYTPQKLKIIPFIMALIVVIMSGKRGALVAMFLMIVFYFFFSGTNNKGKSSNMVWRVVVFLLVMVIVSYIVINVVGLYDLKILYRMEKLEYDGGSGRASRWGFILNAFCFHSDAFQMLFGHGSGAVIKLVGGHAHNDYFEFLYDYGIFAFGFYVLFYVLLIKEFIMMYRRKYVYSREFLCSVIVALCMSIFSFYAVDCTHITSSSICQGLILADWYKIRKGYAEQQVEED